MGNMDSRMSLFRILQAAISFLDFTPVNESFTFTRTSGITDCATITIVQDAILESGEFFIVSVASTSSNIGLPAPRLITIIDSNNVVLEFQSSIFSTTEGTAADVCVVIQAGMIARPVTFTVSPSDGTATEASQDFAPISIVQTFSSNNDSPKCFSMTVNEDTIVESDETFVITLSSPDTPTDRTATVIIHDNDGVSVVLSGSSLSVDEGNVGITTLPLCVQLQNIMTGLDRSVLLLLSTIFGTADVNDFIPLANEQFAIPSSSPLNQDICFDLNINGDLIREPDETFTVTVTVGNSNDVIGSNIVTVTIVDDNDVIADCMSLLSPQNGDVQFTSTLQDSTATYSCITGYMVVGPSSRTCLSSGLWSDSDPTCELVDCESLSAPTNGAVNDPLTTYQSVATYQCNTGYNLIGESDRTCQADGNWSGVEPICQIVDCDVLSDPENGQVTFSSTVYQSQAVYSCNSGFELSQTGSVQRICRANGQWSSFAPQCNPVDCGDLINPDNGAVSLTGTTFMNTATYTCNAGHTLINGDEIRECQSNRTWSGMQPTCQVDCGELVPPSNGMVSYTSGTLLGSMATYMCDAGYDLVGGDALRTCGSDGNWSGMEPSNCLPRDCGDPGAPENGRVSLSSGTTLGSTATYSCDIGHDLIGATLRECGTDGQWTNRIPLCMIVDCGSLSPPIDGTVQLNGTVFGSQAIYSCDVGYSLIGVATRSCLASQDWSDTAPVCQIVDCGAPNNPEDGDVTFTLTVYNAIAVYSCEEGYNLVPSETLRTCQADGNWSGDDRACQPVNCGAETNPTNGQFSAQQTTLGSVAMYSCNTGYDLVGQESVVCQPSGEWSSPPPNCIAVDCGSLDSPANGSVSLSATTFLSLAEYSCDLGYILVGEESRQCQANRTWSGEDPICEAVDCGDLNNPDNGVVSLDETRLNSVATYQCNTGYDLMGDTERRCTELGQWSGSQPVCQIVQCTEVLSSPTNGNLVTTGNTYLSEARYSCVEGFAIVGGPTVRVCQDNGQWSDTQPHCEENMCPGLESLENGVIRITAVGFEAGLLATYECNEGYTISSAVDATRICQLSGEWTGTAPTCTINDCGVDPPTPDNGIVLTSGTTFGSIASYFCNDGYEVHPRGGETRTCLANETWSGVDPTCQPINCGMLGNPINGDVITNGTVLGSLASYSCRAGYELEGNATRVCQRNRSWSNFEPTCLDIDECQGDHGCDQECINDVGGFHCECGTGYQLVDMFTCADIDECNSSNGGCAQLCNNTVGSFFCGCNEGYLLNTDDADCDDIDECQGDHGCDQECINDIGGFHCECRTGYQLVDIFTCADVDECIDSNGGCAQICNNTVGSFTCGCNEGYLLNSDEISCDDIDECDNMELDGCHENATCLNNNGSFECLCNNGYDGDGFLCTDIDECSEGVHICDSNAVCNNTNGGFECACLLGYEGDGLTCENIDECMIGIHKCHEDAECTDSEGSYSCACKLGFSGDGLSCERQCSTVFQLLLNGINNCQQWRLESTEDKILDIQRSIFQEVVQVCPSCEISHIANDEFSCPIGPNSDDVLYRARLYGTRPDNCLELTTALTNWVQSSRATLQVQNSRLLVTGNCMVEIDSLQSDLDCPLPTTEAGGVEPGASVGSGTVIGAAAGVVGAILLLTIIVVIIAIAIILKKKKQKRFTLPSHFIEPDEAYSSLTHSSTPLQDTRRSRRHHQNDYQESNILETSTFNPEGNVLPTLGRTLSDRKQHRLQSPYAEVGKVGNGKAQQDEFYEKVYDDGYHFDVEEVYDKAQELPAAEYEAMEKVLAENPLYAKVEVSNF